MRFRRAAHSSKGVAHSPALVTHLKTSRFPFTNEKDNNISFGERLVIGKLLMAALAEAQKTWVKSKQRCGTWESGREGRLRAQPGPCSIQL